MVQQVYGIYSRRSIPGRPVFDRSTRRKFRRRGKHGDLGSLISIHGEVSSNDGRSCEPKLENVSQYHIAGTSDRITFSLW